MIVQFWQKFEVRTNDFSTKFPKLQLELLRYHVSLLDEAATKTHR